MKLDHATIVTGDLEGARRFLCSVVGLSEGPRPPFGVSGYKALCKRAAGHSSDRSGRRLVGETNSPSY